jgi:hypothetical protein
MDLVALAGGSSGKLLAVLAGDPCDQRPLQAAPGCFAIDPLDIAVVGAALASATEVTSTRTVGILTLSTAAVAPAWLGVVLWKQPHAAATAEN